MRAHHQRAVADDPIRAIDANVRRYLMCPPLHYGVEYRINPWMQPGAALDHTLAGRQWETLRQTLVSFGHCVHVVTAAPRLPDQVFAANAGLIIGDTALPATMATSQRRPEQAYHRAWFTSVGLQCLPRCNATFEGEGDVVLVAGKALAACGFRTSIAAHRELATAFGLSVETLELVDARWYHLDMALMAIDDHNVAYYPAAFSRRSQRRLAALFPDAVLASHADAMAFGLNGISDGRRIVMPAGADRLAAVFRARGLTVIEVNMSELHRAGGSAKCCVLELHAPGPMRSRP